MEPEALVATEVREGVQRIDGTAVRRPGVGGDDQRMAPRLGVGLDRAGERIDPNPMCVVGREYAQLVGTEPDQPSGARHRGVRLVGDVGDREV